MKLKCETLESSVPPCYCTVPPCYFKFGNFRENFIFANSVKRHICDVKNSQLEYGLPVSGNERVISPFRECAKFRENKPSRKFPNLQYSAFNH